MIVIFAVPVENTGNAAVAGASIVNEHEKPETTNFLFDTDAFLQYSCLDEDPTKGLEKAFFVQSSLMDGFCSPEDLYKVGLLTFDNEALIKCGNPDFPFHATITTRVTKTKRRRKPFRALPNGRILFLNGSK
jgi:hypothetical protein